MSGPNSAKINALDLPFKIEDDVSNLLFADELDLTKNDLAHNLGSTYGQGVAYSQWRKEEMTKKVEATHEYIETYLKTLEDNVKIVKEDLMNFIETIDLDFFVSPQKKSKKELARKWIEEIQVKPDPVSNRYGENTAQGHRILSLPGASTFFRSKQLLNTSTSHWPRSIQRNFASFLSRITEYDIHTTKTMVGNLYRQDIQSKLYTFPISTPEPIASKEDWENMDAHF